VSHESLSAFLADVQHDEDLRQELRNAWGETGLPAEALIAFASEKGYEIKAEDLGGELGDQQLDSVAGGRGEWIITAAAASLRVDGDKSREVLSRLLGVLKNFEDGK
jgi:predicted ribosomally synthesized peptide with nif11-like leader